MHGRDASPVQPLAEANVISQPGAPLSPDLCPPTPDGVPEAVDAALDSRSALRSAQDQWSQCDTESADYRRIVAEYEHRLADSLGDRVQLREAMRGFGAYYAGEVSRQSTLCSVCTRR